jgi:UDP-N-acetylmuramoylalanine--D-glutamate ligase
MIQLEEKIDTFKGKKVLVVGLARSGTGAANLLSLLGANVTITDTKSRNSLKGQIKKLLPPVKVITDRNPEEIFDSSEMIVVSPGVPLDIHQLEHAGAKGIPIIGELEVAYQIVARSELRVAVEARKKIYETHNTELATPAFIGITGTNGKSTTTTLIDLMLKESGYKTLLAGNIGNALTGEILKAIGSHPSAFGEGLTSGRRLLNADYIVTEISSFQLESIKEFRPRIAAVLNITPDHLDRYGSMKDYADAKARIFENQIPEDYLLLNADDSITMDLYNAKCKMKSSKFPDVFFFSRKKEVKGIFQKEGSIYCNMPHVSDFPLISTDEIKIEGAHNLENAMAASLASLLSGCSHQAVRNVLRVFPGLEHRLEFVEEIKGIKFINDSKGTNVGAVAKSLEDFNNVILIMGGKDKGGDFSVLRDLIKRKVKVLLLLGDAKEKIAHAMLGITEVHMVNDLKEAVEGGMSKASAGDVVLLSPGCASFDMFNDFEERGRRFKQAVRGLLHFEA